jgi:hypothetical protein
LLGAVAAVAAVADAAGPGGPFPEKRNDNDNVLGPCAGGGVGVGATLHSTDPSATFCPHGSKLPPKNYSGTITKNAHGVRQDLHEMWCVRACERACVRAPACLCTCACAGAGEGAGKGAGARTGGGAGVGPKGASAGVCVSVGVGATPHHHRCTASPRVCSNPLHRCHFVT